MEAWIEETPSAAPLSGAASMFVPTEVCAAMRADWNGKRADQTTRGRIKRQESGSERREREEALVAERGDDLRRFVRAQECDYAAALEEIRAGSKRGHWIWFIFPQLRGLGSSPNARYFGIDGLEEAWRYLAHPLLGARLEACCAALLAQPKRDPGAVMGSGIDAMKLRSSMTLFAIADGRPDSVYRRVLEAFYGGREDDVTLNLLHRAEGG